jgi:hypothetical protein
MSSPGDQKRVRENRFPVGHAAALKMKSKVPAVSHEARLRTSGTCARVTIADDAAGLYDGSVDIAVS